MTMTKSDWHQIDWCQGAKSTFSWDFLVVTVTERPGTSVHRSSSMIAACLILEGSANDPCLKICVSYCIFMKGLSVLNIYIYIYYMLNMLNIWNRSMHVYMYIKRIKLASVGEKMRKSVKTAPSSPPTNQREKWHATAMIFWSHNPIINNFDRFRFKSNIIKHNQTWYAHTHGILWDWDGLYHIPSQRCLLGPDTALAGSFRSPSCRGAASTWHTRLWPSSVVTAARTCDPCTIHAGRPRSETVSWWATEIDCFG